MTSSFSFDADPPRPETFLRAQNHDPFGRKSSFSPRCADDGLCHADAIPVSEVPETPPSTIKSSGGASVSDKDDDGLLSRCMLYEGEEGLLDVPRSKVQTSSGQVAETSPPQLSRKVIQHATSSSLYIKVERSKQAVMHRFRDGRESNWSSNKGETWSEGPALAWAGGRKIQTSSHPA